MAISEMFEHAIRDNQIKPAVRERKCFRNGKCESGCVVRGKLRVNGENMGITLAEKIQLISIAAAELKGDRLSGKRNVVH